MAAGSDRPGKRVHPVTKLKRHLTVANVLSITAVFIALSATAVAATKAVNIARQAVTNAKIKTQAVTSGKIKNNGVVTADLANGSVTAGKIANGAVNSAKLTKEAVSAKALAKNSVTNAKIGTEAVTTGKLGNESVTAAKISSGTWHQILKNVTYVTETTGPQSETNRTLLAKCPTGKEAIAGGVRVTGANTKVVPTESAPEFGPTGARTGWSASARELEAEAGSWTLLTYAVCAEL
jgi:hypothetical protein